MAINFKNIFVGARFKPVATLTSDSSGQVQTFATDSKTYLHNGTTRSPLVTEAQTATLTNKTIDANGTGNSISNLEVTDLAAGVLNTSTTLSGATDAQVPSALAVQTLVSNSTGAVQTDVDDLITLSGVAANSVDLGTFTGTTIPDASTVKSALQSLETGLEAHIADTTDAHDASAISTTAIVGVTGDDVQEVLESLKTQIDTKGAGDVVGPVSSTNFGIATYNGTTGKLLRDSGATISLGGALTVASLTPTNALAIANGGTGQTTKAAAFDSLSPMTTGGDIIYGGASGTATRLANGTAGQVLTSAGGTAAPTWANAASVSGINYILNPNAEFDTSGWTTYADAAGAAPVDGTGGSPTVTLTRSTSSPLRGVASFLYTKPASNVQGQGFSYSFTTDSADAGKVLQGSFDYQIASGTFADNDLSVWIYDVTNSVMIQPAPYLLKNSGIIEKFPVEFQTAINSTSYRLIIHQGSTSASAATLKFDNFNFGPQAKLYGSAVTDSINFTPTGSWTTNTSYTGAYWRHGDKASGWIKVSTSGAPTATALTVNLPSGLVIDTAKVSPSILANAGIFGYAQARDAGTATYDLSLAYNSTTSLAVIAKTRPTTYIQDDTSATQVIPFTFGAGDEVLVYFQDLPIVGWSSSQVMSSDADTRVVSASAFRSASAQALTASSAQKLLFNATLSDSHGAYDNTLSRYTLKVPGEYNFKGSLMFIGATSGSSSLYLYRNGASIQTTYIATNTSDFGANFEFKDPTGKVGDYYEIFMNPATTMSLLSSASQTGGSRFTIERLSGPSQIMASESVSALYTGAPPTGTLNNSVNTVTFGTKVKDSHNAYSGGVYTVPVSGTYSISAATYQAATYSSGNQTLTYIVIDGVAKYFNSKFIEGSATIVQTQVTTLSIPLLAGQLVTIATLNNATSPTFQASALANYFSITRTGNY